MSAEQMRTNALDGHSAFAWIAGNRSIATWISFEAILDAVEYPGIFMGNCRFLRSPVEQKVEEPSSADEMEDKGATVENT